jgi:hypothetical protein
MLWRPSQRSRCRWHEHSINGVLVVHRQFRLSHVRHPEPFSKRDDGRLRREERRIVRDKKEAVVRRPGANEH